MEIRKWDGEPEDCGFHESIALEIITFDSITNVPLRSHNLRGLTSVMPMNSCVDFVHIVNTLGQ